MAEAQYQLQAVIDELAQQEAYVRTLEQTAKALVEYDIRVRRALRERHTDHHRRYTVNVNGVLESWASGQFRRVLRDTGANERTIETFLKNLHRRSDKTFYFDGKNLTEGEAPSEFYDTHAAMTMDPDEANAEIERAFDPEPRASTYNIHASWKDLPFHVEDESGVKRYNRDAHILEMKKLGASHENIVSGSRQRTRTKTLRY